MFFKVFFAAFPFFLVFLLILTFILPSKMRAGGRVAWLAALTLCASKFLFFDILGRSMFAPELPEVLIWVWSCAYSGMCLLVPVSIAALPVRYLTRTPRSKFWLVSLPAVAWTAAAAGVRSGVVAPAVREVEMRFASLPAALDGYRIALVTDVHASAASRRWRTQAIVDAVNSLDADLVCLAGDYSDGMSEDQFENAEPICSLKGRDGVLAVTGNHEYYYDTFRWMERYREAGLSFLSSECAFPRPGLAVAGVDDPQCAMKGFPPPDVDKAFASATNGEFRILLQHRPYIDYDKLHLPHPSAKVDLQLSGHTHGGVAPVMRNLVAAFNDGMYSGVYRGQDGRTIYVSSGAGQWAGFPVRFFNDSEICLITLRRGEKE